MADALSPEDAAALARLREHLRGIGDDNPRVTLDCIGDAWWCEAAARAHGGDTRLAVSVWRKTAGEAICEAGRLCGVAL